MIYNSNICLFLGCYKYIMITNIDELKEIVSKLNPHGYCGETQIELYKLLKTTGDHIFKEFCYNSHISILPYPEYVLDSLLEILKQSKCCFVTMSNNSGVNITFGHHFTLILIGSIIYRVESYGMVEYEYDKILDELKLVKDNLIYGPCVKEVGNEECFIKTFLPLFTSSLDRLTYWNSLFSAIETRDNLWPYLEVDVIC